ncbi:UPF0187-domain-containing protein [Aspergillus steynii IBT 23096]|uniref:UPF0187-domain-containing protein n=1 Tax=Aspergillus steynii IBT 23096 TaxID=1392250 RepID=A0A2I2G895_9EURO|nr:UPF0187-domain-containing protein [Aspergillus steynii IBT 23096]PLB49110.1 UPF0187-domain-containing protein [Aspergillus steynii IBT 23096]
MTTSSRTESPPILPTFDSKPIPQVHYDLEAGPEPEFLSPGRRLTPRPTFLDGCFSPKDGHSTLKRQGSSDLVRYFHGPRDLDKHTKWPVFFRLHGSVLPKLIIPLSFIAIWSTVVTLVCKYVYDLGIDNILLTVTGLVVGLSLSFQSSTAYERWADGRKYWSLLHQASRNLARTIWICTTEREGEEGKEDVLDKLSAMNLILAFAVALKHKLRFEPDIGYDDLAGLVGHLDTFAKEAYDRQRLVPPRKSFWKSAGEYLSLSIAESDPRKHVKRSKKPLGHLPLEILNHLSVYVNQWIASDALSFNVYQTQAINSLASLNEVVTGTERVLDTPLPTAYTISIAQITWIYVLVLPFQLYDTLSWVTIPGSIAAAYIILGLSAIGREIENPFGDDVNDLPLDTYCRRIAQELDIITAMPAPNVDDFGSRDENLVFFPHSTAGYPEWKDRSLSDIRAILKTRVMANAHSPSPLNTPNASGFFGAAGAVSPSPCPSLGSRQCLSPGV